MTTHMNVGGSWEALTFAHAHATGTRRRCPELWAKVAGVWKLTHSDLSATVDDATANAGVDQTATEIVTVTPANGAAPYTYSWVRTSGSAVPTISNATSPSVLWGAPDPGPYVADWACTVTDAYGQSVGIGVHIVFFGSS